MQHTETKSSPFCLVKPLKAAPTLSQQILKNKFGYSQRVLPLISTKSTGSGDTILRTLKGVLHCDLYQSVQILQMFLVC